MFKGLKPAAQPRSLRSIAESHADSKNFPTDPPKPEGGMYQDPADAAKSPAGAAKRTASSADKKPIGGAR